ncbi:MAG: hypothetical protein SGARI_006793 [Bacillariaceae sp.]
MTAGENATGEAANTAAAAVGRSEQGAYESSQPPPAAAGAPAGDDSDEDGGPGVTDAARAQKRKERLEQNRISARESRKRKKTMIEELQRTVITLSKENKDLNDRNEQLRSQLMDIGAKVCFRL